MKLRIDMEHAQVADEGALLAASMATRLHQLTALTAGERPQHSQ